jgi:hypothetical protein
MVVVAMCLTISLTAEPANAAPVVTFYNNQAVFLEAISKPTVLDFEGIAADNSSVYFGKSYHTGEVTFSGYGNDMYVVGKNSQTLGAPFDSALLIPSVDPGSILATFDPNSNVTAVGGFFLNLFGNTQETGVLQLTGLTGALETLSMPLGIATSGKSKTFFAYSVAGDTISSLSVSSSTDTAAFDDFTYASSVPEPASAFVIFVGSIGLLTRRRARGRSSLSVND